MPFAPDYRNIVDAAYNRVPKRTPLYEHIIAPSVAEQVTGRKFAQLLEGDDRDLVEYFRQYADFYRQCGYDTVSFECCVGPAMPGSGALGNHAPGCIKNREDFEKYPWAQVPDWYFAQFDRYFAALDEAMPAGMRAIGGVGNGVFELAQEVVGYMDLCYIRMDDPELYADLFRAVGDMMTAIWSRFMERWGDLYAVLRFGDDLGFKTAPLIPGDDIRNYIIPQYRRVVDVVHAHGKPFLLHSCGNIFEVMEDIIAGAQINAKHSNEDVIAPFAVWVDRYGDRIGNFGGVDTDILCSKTEPEIREVVREAMAYCQGKGGFALASGNSIPDYVPAAGFLAMVDEARRIRGDY
jgi:uroporphyrinogen decarboxylase